MSGRTPTGSVQKPRLGNGRTGSPAPLSDILSTLDLPVQRAAGHQTTGAPSTSSTPPSVPASLPAAERPDDPNSLLLAAKALVFCGFPYKRSPLTTITREAQLGSDTHLTVYLSTTEPDVPIPFGADRALLAWITTLTYDTGFVTFTSLTDFFEAFQLARSGVQYRRFEERLHRLLSLSLSLILRTPSGIARLNMRPLQRAYTPRDGAEARRLLAAETGSQLSLLPSDLKRYGILLDPPSMSTCATTPSSCRSASCGRFHNRPLFWDAASYLLYRCWSARTPPGSPGRLVRRQLASVDQLDRRLAPLLNRVADEIRDDYPDFPAQVETGTHDLVVAPFRPPEEHFRA